MSEITAEQIERIGPIVGELKAVAEAIAQPRPSASKLCAEAADLIDAMGNDLDDEDAWARGRDFEQGVIIEWCREPRNVYLDAADEIERGDHRGGNGR